MTSSKTRYSAYVPYGESPSLTHSTGASRYVWTEHLATGREGGGREGGRLHLSLEYRVALHYFFLYGNSVILDPLPNYLLFIVPFVHSRLYVWVFEWQALIDFELYLPHLSNHGIKPLGFFFKLFSRTNTLSNNSNICKHISFFFSFSLHTHSHKYTYTLK